MATCYGGIGNALVNDSEPQDINANIQDEYQANINDLENIEPDHQAGLRALTRELEQLWQTVKANNNDPMDAISHLECRLNQLALTLHLPTPMEPIGEVLNKYTDTLCNTPKKTSFVNSLLQDITVLKGNDASKLEDWLTEIEATSDLTGKSRTKLAQVKSKGLIRTLISEALTSNKTWEEIKDSLHLQICNLDIHTSVSHSIDIQQKENESLAAYVHPFKKEASRCKFDNDIATIRIFIKGLKNVHTLASRVYEKGPQNLTDAIKEVEKLQAAQQFTATLILTSSVNVMSSDDDKCFQCHKLGHMACHCPCIKCFDCDEYGHVAADCPDKIPLSGTPTRQTNTNSNTRCHDRSTSCHDHCNRHSTMSIETDTVAMTIETDIDSIGQGPTPTVIDTGVTVRVTHEGAAPGCITDLHITTYHDTET